MKKVLTFGLFLAGVIGFSSCDKIDDPIVETVNVETGIVWDDSISSPVNLTVRNILMEEYTGHKCAQCPAGTKEIVRLDSILGDQLTPVAIHAGIFALPEDDGDFTTDFRVNAGITIHDALPATGFPAGMINRMESEGKRVHGRTKWEDLIDDAKNDVPKVAISLKSLYDDSTQIFQNRVEVTWLENVSEVYHLSLFLAEDSIVDWQNVDNVDDEFYVHRHVMRAALNSPWGDAIETNTAGDTSSFEINYNVDPEWKLNHCEIVAFVYDRDNFNVLQVANVHFPTHQ